MKASLMERDTYNKIQETVHHSVAGYLYYDEDSDSPSIFGNLCQSYTCLFLFLNIDIVKSVT